MRADPTAAGLLLFLVPGHLDVLEDLLVGGVGLVREAFEFEDHLVELREAEAQRVLVGELVDQGPGDLLVVFPGQFHARRIAAEGRGRQMGEKEAREDTRPTGVWRKCASLSEAV